MTDPTEKKLHSAKQAPVNWYWVGTLLFLALLGAFLDSKLSPENVRFIGNPLTCVGIWGAVLCLLFKKDRAKPVHPHQAGLVLAIDARVIALPTMFVGHLISMSRFGLSAPVNLFVGVIVFLLFLISRYLHGIPYGTKSWLGRRCQICGTIIIGSNDVVITKAPARPIVTHCHTCGTNCEGPIEQPLTPTAQEILNGNKAILEIDHLPADSLKIQRDPIPFPYGEYFKILPALIGLILAGLLSVPFLMMFLMSGPYLTLKWLFVLCGMTLFVFIGSLISGKLKAPCPHCQANLIKLAFGRGPLARSCRYRQKDGRYVLEVIPRYCPYCGKNIEEPVANPQDRVD